MVKELVGNCSECGKKVFCLHGFLNGILDDKKKLLCFECSESRGKQ